MRILLILGVCAIAAWPRSICADGPRLVFPENLALGQPSEITLSWEQGALTNRIKNGSFENGGTGWTFSPPWQMVLSSTAADGQRVAQILPNVSRNSLEAFVSQQVSLPAVGASATLSWMDATSGASSTPRFSLEISGSTTPLQVLHDVSVQASSGDPWTAHQVDLTPYLGKTISLAFWLSNPRREACSINLDNVRLEVVPVSVNYEVYVGRTTPLGPTDLQGSTSSLSWSLNGLEPGTTNYWSVHQLSDGRREKSQVYTFVVEGTFLVGPALRLGTVGTGLELRFATQTGIRYQAEATTLSAPWLWQDLGTEIVGDGLEAVQPIDAPGEGRLVRIKARR